MKKSKESQGGGKKIEHLGVPLVVALVNINMNTKCDEKTHFLNDLGNNVDYVQQSPMTYDSNEPEYKSRSIEFQSISDQMYDSLLQSVLEEPIEKIPDSNIDSHISSKKHTRKNKLRKSDTEYIHE